MKLINTLGSLEGLPSLNLYTGASANITNWIGKATMKLNLEEGTVKCYERESIGTLGRVGRELSDNTKMPWPLRRVGHPESDRTSAVYQRNI